MGDWKNCDAVECDPAVLGGAWVFRGTRVPVAALFENLKDGVTPQEFVALFPGVTRSQVDTVLEYEIAAASSAS
jgi:uncharacterized protein (DUF433 family)